MCDHINCIKPQKIKHYANIRQTRIKPSPGVRGGGGVQFRSIDTQKKKDAGSEQVWFLFTGGMMIKIIFYMHPPFYSFDPKSY